MRKSKLAKVFVTVFLSTAAGLLFSMAALAAGPVSGIIWDEERGTVEWNEYNDPSTAHPVYQMVLYRGNEKRMTSMIKTRETKYSFASVITSKGTGQYYVKISVNGIEDSEGISELYTVDGTLLNQLKARVVAEREAAAAASEAGMVGWIRYPDSVWRYKKADGTYATGWLLDNGSWYYLASDGVMLTGWQIVNNRWYFLSDSGAMLANTVTPDGVQVNGKGEAVVNGVPLDASWQPKNTAKNAARTLTELDSIKINSTETKVDAGVIRPMRVTSSGKFSVETYSFSKPYEQWTAGQPVLVTCTIDAYTGYAFTDRTKITFNRGTLVSNTGNSVERTIVYAYYPRFVLASPANVSLDDMNVLHWTPVQNASRYIVTVVLDGMKENDRIISGTSFDLSEFINGHREVGVHLTAIAGESMRNYWYDSFATVIDDVEEFRAKGSISYSGKRIRYYDENGDAVEGWAEINGYWYHFTKGLSEEPGWFKDSDKFWYYFDDASRMKIGEITDNGVRYFLNDGSVKDVPLGAWVEGR